MASAWVRLGLIYGAADRQGAKQRIAIAVNVLPDFGIATRCGIARGSTATEVRELLELHAALADADCMRLSGSSA